MMKESMLNLKSLNHISLVYRSVEKSLDFYQSVLGFFPIRRPGSFDFKVEKNLKEMEIEYVKRMVEEGGIYIDQLFFHDPDATMIEICNCDNLPVTSLAGEPVRPCNA
ncbi:unnamed protein product [Prunus armeniaca]|uniref:Glyoxalase/fosfomycin resistance/dioxygenase domain-containing protein n=1 Tax=Prunus armeniaca TaxID=36596 RepID=A0A6J5YC43_PRUAR|nr:unnamed protein product [Prunus armeniaca]